HSVSGIQTGADRARNRSRPMNKLLIGVLVVVAGGFGGGQVPAGARVPESTRYVSDQQSLLYATYRCGYCARTRKYFQERNISYLEYDIEKSREGRAQYDRLQGKGVPLLVVNGEVIRGYNPAAIEQAMKRMD